MYPNAMLAGGNAGPAPPVYLHTPIWVPGQRTRVILSARETAGQFAVLEQIAPHGAATPCHIHHQEDELIYVLDGELMVYLDGMPRAVTRGALVLLPCGREHAFVVESVEARVLTVFSPAGFERLIIEAGQPVVGPLRPMIEVGACEVERMVTAAARYECDITGPPPRPRTRLPNSLCSHARALAD